MPYDIPLHGVAMIKGILSQLAHNTGEDDPDPVVPIHTTFESLREHPPKCDQYHTTLSVLQNEMKQKFQHAYGSPTGMGTGPRPEVAPNWFEQPAGGIAVNAFVGIDENASSSG